MDVSGWMAVLVNLDQVLESRLDGAGWRCLDGRLFNVEVLAHRDSNVLESECHQLRVRGKAPRTYSLSEATLPRMAPGKLTATEAGSSLESSMGNLKMGRCLTVW